MMRGSKTSSVLHLPRLLSFVKILKANLKTFGNGRIALKSKRKFAVEDVPKWLLEKDNGMY